MAKKSLQIAAFLGFTAIILGAFGAHGLKQVLTTDQLVSFESGVKYQMYHALFLLFVSQTQLVSEKMKNAITWITVLGILLFSFSIYALCLQGVIGVNLRFLGPVTPIGGTLLIASWLMLFFGVTSQKRMH